MTGVSLTQLTAATTLADTDLFEVSTNIAGTPTTKKVAKSVIATAVFGGAVVLSPTGTADSTAINAALTAAGAAGGGTVRLGPGLYDITSTVLIPSNCALEGSGPATILKLHALADCRVVSNADVVSGNSNVTLRNMQIDGNGAAQTIAPNNTGTGTDAVYFIFATNVEVSGCYIHDGNRHNILVSDSCTAIRVENNGLQNSLGLSNCSTFNITDMVFSGNVCSGANETGFKNDSSHTITVTGNTFFNNTTHQIYCTNGTSVTVTGNSIRGGLNGFRCVSMDFVTFTGNSVRSCSQHGLAIFQNVQNLVIAGNIIRDIGSGTANTYDGININDSGTACTYIVIGNNSISDANAKMRSGIRTASNSNLVTVGPNIITGQVGTDIVLVGNQNRTGKFTAILSPGTMTAPANSTSYLFATVNNIGASTNANLAKFYVPRACTLVAAYVLFHNSGTLGTAETSTINVRVNNTTDTVISAAVANNAVNTEANNTAMTLGLASGDYLAIKWTTPAWATPATNVRPCVVLHFE